MEARAAKRRQVDDLFNTWIMPVKGAAPVEGSSWYSFAGKTCFPDHGGDFAVDGHCFVHVWARRRVCWELELR